MLENILPFSYTIVVPKKHFSFPEEGTKSFNSLFDAHHFFKISFYNVASMKRDYYCIHLVLNKL